MIGSEPSTRPRSSHSSKPLAIFVKSEPEAIGQTMRSGVSQPSRSEEHTSELQSLMRISYAVFCLKKKKKQKNNKDKKCNKDRMKRIRKNKTKIKRRQKL